MALDLLKSTLIFIFLEKVLPKYPEQPILRPEWQLALGYFTLNHLILSVLLVIANGFAPRVFGWAVNEQVQAFVSGIWLPAQVLLILFFDWLAGSRIHLAETVIDRAMVMVPLYLLGPRTEALNIYVIIVAFQAVLIHSNFRLEFGPLGYLFVTPKFHHWHHSKDRPAIDTNYAAHFPLLDLLLGTFHMPKEHWPKEYDTVTRLPRTFLGQLTNPFRRSSEEKAREGSDEQS